MIRAGIGFDAHRFGDGRKLMLGGVEIPHARGLRGHSDADVLLHALADALLGAAGMDDIGTHFPDSDEAWKDAASSLFVQRIMAMLKRKHWVVQNVDLTLLAEAPKIAPYRAAIRDSVAHLLKVSRDAVNVKASTTDHMGFVGRGEGIAAQAIVLLAKTKGTSAH